MRGFNIDRIALHEKMRPKVGGAPLPGRGTFPPIVNDYTGQQNLTFVTDPRQNGLFPGQFVVLNTNLTPEMEYQARFLRSGMPLCRV